MTVSPSALTLLNSFLDQMLFSILASARSIRLHELRSAVPDVLKPKLGREAVAGADEELKEYLGPGDEEEPLEFHESQEEITEFDLELAWKLARLRCMVYTRFGDLEEEDEDEYIEREQLDDRGDGQRRSSSRFNSVTPAGAIFLTSILEYLAEQALYYAGLHTQRRVGSARSRPQASTSRPGTASSQFSEHMILEEIDMKQVGRDSPLLRLWRTWKRPMRSPSESIASVRPFTPEMISRSVDHGPLDRSQVGGVGPNDIPSPRPATVPESPIMQTPPSLDPRQIPLPISSNDVNEIEVPGLASEPYDDGSRIPSEVSVTDRTRRPRSVDFSHGAFPPSNSDSGDSQIASPPRNFSRPIVGRTRSHSLPTPPQTPFVPSRGVHANEADAPLPDVPSQVEDEGEKSRSDQLRGAADDVTAETQQEEGTSPSKRHGILVGAFSALAGATGLANLVNSGQTDNAESGRVSRGEEAKTSRTKQENIDRDSSISKEAIGNGASINTASDFDHLHLPIMRQPISEPTPAAETDPEDLALSSADEDTVTALTDRNQSSVLTEREQPRTRLLPSANIDSPRAVVHELEAPANHYSVTVPHSKSRPDFGNARSQPENQRVIPSRDVGEDDYDRFERPTNTSSSEVQNDMPVNFSSTENPGTEYSQNRESKSSEYSSNSARVLGYSRDELGQPAQSWLNERVTTQRAVPSATMKEVNNSRHTPSASISNARESRPGTATSQLSAKRAPLRIRTSSDESGNSLLRDKLESEDKKKSLEILIRGDETLHYTLTPRTARETEARSRIQISIAEALLTLAVT